MMTVIGWQITIIEMIALLITMTAITGWLIAIIAIVG
jgi:hypothetical protein